MVKTGEWISQGWALVKEDLWTHVLLIIIVSLGSSVTSGILAGPLLAGYYWILLRKLSDAGYRPAIGDVGKGFEVFLHSLLAAIVGGPDRAVGRHRLRRGGICDQCPGALRHPAGHGSAHGFLGGDYRQRGAGQAGPGGLERVCAGAGPAAVARRTDLRSGCAGNLPNRAGGYCHRIPRRLRHPIGRGPRRADDHGATSRRPAGAAHGAPTATGDPASASAHRTPGAAAAHRLGRHGQPSAEGRTVWDWC